MKVVIENIGKDIYPDLTDEAMKNLNTLKDVWNLCITFQFAGGFSIEFDDDICIPNFDGPEDIRFIYNDKEIKYTETFDSLRFETNEGEIIEIQKVNLYKI